MPRVSSDCYSKPAPWVIAKRLRERQMGFRAVQVLAFIRDHMSVRGRPPSYREICDHLGIDKGNLHRLIVSLEKRGELKRAEHHGGATPPIIRLVA